MNEEERFWNEEDKIKKEEEINRIRNRNGLIDYKRLATLIDAKEWDINDELVWEHFLVQGLGGLLKKLKKSKNNPEKK